MRTLAAAMTFLLLTTVTAALAADEAPPAAQPPARLMPRLGQLLQGTRLKFMVQEANTAVVLIRGESGVHPVTVRILDELLVAFADLAEAQENEVPVQLWRKAAEANAEASLAHVGYLKKPGKFIAVSGVEVDQGTSPLLRAMIMHVAVMTDNLQQPFKDLLEVR
jgi:hypothetical protein